MSDAIVSASQTITLAQGNYSGLSLLATAVNGSKTSQTFTQSLRDLAERQNYAGETNAVTTTYRNNAKGSKHDDGLCLPIHLYPQPR